MKVTKSNQELLLLLRDGNRVAFYNIYQRYCKRVYGFVLQYIKQEEDAEGIVQDVFIKVWENRSKIDVHTSFESFLFTVAYNATISLLRKRTTEKKYLEHLKSVQQTDETPDFTDEIYFNELNKKLQALLNKLTPCQKEIFQLSREQGLSHREIAEKLNISVNTVKKHIANMLSFLKLHIDKDLIASLLFVYLFF